MAHTERPRPDAGSPVPAPPAARVDCVVFVGLPGSGKTTFFRQRFASAHRHISKDLFPNARNRDARQAGLIRAALAEGASFVVDNTNVKPEDRAAIVALARAGGARVIGYYFDVPVADCLRRNRQREGRQRVPDVAIFAMAARLKRPVVAEGFDELYVVRVPEDGRFEVRAEQA